MAKPDKVGVSAPHHAQQVTPAASVTPPPHPADSAISYVVQTTQAPPIPPGATFLDKLQGATLLGVFATLVTTWLLDRRKRRLDTKRKLYLKVTDAMHEGGQVLASFSNMDATIQTLSARFVDCIAAFTKAEVVAGNHLLRALIEMKNKAGEAHNSLMRARMWAEPHLKVIREKLPQKRQKETEINATIAELQRMNIEGINTPESNARFQRVQAFYHHLQSQLANISHQEATSRAAMEPIIKELVEKAANFVREIIPYRVKVLVLMRKELEFGFLFDAVAYERLQQDMATKALHELDLLISEAHKIWGGEQEPTVGEGLKDEPKP